MNLAKKIKLALLTSAVMLSSKGSYAIDQEQDSRATPIVKKISFSSLMPVSSSNQLPHRLPASIQLNPRVRAMIVRTTGNEPDVSINEKNQQELQDVINKVPSVDLSDRLQAIESNLLKRFTPFGKGGSAFIQGYCNIVATALPLSNKQIIDRGLALENMVEDLFTYNLRYNGLPRFSNSSKKYPGKDNHFFPVLSAHLNLIGEALTLEASQINHRTNYLRYNGDHLLPNDPSKRLQAVQALMKLKTTEILDRAEIMNDFEVGKYFYISPPSYLHNDETLLAASHLSNTDLKSRLESLNRLIGDASFKATVDKTLVQKIAFELEAPTFFSRLSNILQSKDTFNDLFASLADENCLKLFLTSLNLSPDQLNARLATINQYKILFTETRTERSGAQNYADRAELLELNVEEIYTRAEKKHYETYYRKELLPQIGEKFRTINVSDLSDDELSEVLAIYPFGKNFSHEQIMPILSKFGKIYSDMYKPPLLARPHVLTSSSVPSSSSSVARPSSSHDVPTPHTFRTTGVNPKAKIKHSAIAIQLHNREMQSSAYQLIINHRTTKKGPMVRFYNPNTKTYIELGTLPASSSGFCNTIFDFFPLAEALRKNSPLESVISTYLSFMGGISDVHSFTIQSGGKTLKEVIFGDKDSELQPGIHVYAPETDGDAHEWSGTKHAGV